MHMIYKLERLCFNANYCNSQTDFPFAGSLTMTTSVRNLTIVKWICEGKTCSERKIKQTFFVESTSRIPWNIEIGPSFSIWDAFPFSNSSLPHNETLKLPRMNAHVLYSCACNFHFRVSQRPSPLFSAPI